MRSSFVMVPTIMAGVAGRGKSLGRFAQSRGGTISTMARQQARFRRGLRRVLGLGALAGLSYAVWRAIEAGRDDRDITWQPQPFPFPPQPRAGPPDRPAQREPWIAPLGATCPASHPVKAKLASGIFHVPGGASYDRTRPDRCYLDAATAEGDGLRPAKR